MRDDGAVVAPGLRAWGPVDGVPLLALHSAGLDGRSFGPLAAALPTHRVLAPDLRGHGVTPTPPVEVTIAGMVDDVIQLGERAADAPPHLLGTSMGGVVAGLAAAARPELWASLTVVCTPDRGYPAFVDRAEAAEAGGMTAVVDDTLSRWFAPEALTSGSVAYARACLEAFDPAVWSALWRDFARFEGFASVPVGLPVHVVAGTADRSTPPPVLERVAAALGATAPVRLVEGGEHQLVLERPDAVAAVWR